MAVANSNTFARPEITATQSVIAGDIAALLKIPLGATHDLFQVVDICQRYADELIEVHNHAEYIALCGRLLAGLNVLKVVLKSPLPKHLIEQLTVNENNFAECRNPLSTDSETACEYCSALTMVLLNQQIMPEQQEQISELLFELLTMLAEDLKAPRFIRTTMGLAMIGGEAVPGIH
ncbi:hypothetical protein M976_03776 [Buttiauxella ferragutiae ATCC 51602]|uniref:Uncharacterized protein n=1 Tax=Buttiauxella ferragutiae ATCC 51602 TaxID=1354252 RepID=A0ABX2W451_9ENTR|nr:hypothetical protein [Buttiauxella ferragutiae]OAT25432.1 hypothetical protein M976_03776 [Buttiauxella ferragutiae ATCC 51602]